MASVHMEKLRELTPNLPPIPFPDTLEHSENFKIHKMGCGTSMAFNLLNQDEISVARWFNSSGTEFPTHSHAEREWVIIYSGSMFIKIGEQEEKRLLPGQFEVIDPSVNHSARFLEDTWYIAITIPRSKFWPGSKEQ